MTTMEEEMTTMEEEMTTMIKEVTNDRQKEAHCVLDAAIAGVLLLSAAGTLSLSSSQLQGQQQQQQQQVLGDFQARNDTGTIAAGGGGQSQL